MSLKKKKIVLTGKFEGYSRKSAGEALKKAGASVTSSVSGATDVLIAGKKAGSKLYKAADKGIPILAEGHLKLLLDGEPLEDVIALARTFYTIERADGEPEGTSYNMRGGVPPIGADRWPTYDGPMDHLFTLDLETMPALQVHLPGYRALSLFVSDMRSISMYDISRPSNSMMRLVLSTQAQIDEAGDPPDEKAAQKVFDWLEPVEHGWDELERYACRERVLGGVPCWCQGNEHQGNFLMQIGEWLGVSGDGLIYVFDDSVFAQFT